MEKLHEAMNLGQIVSAVPAAGPYFSRQKIDFCCGGHRSLVEAADEAGRPAADLLRELEKIALDTDAQTKQKPEAMASDELAEHIEVQHHHYLREQLPLISEWLDAVMRAHGLNHPELFELHQLYSHLRGDLEQHLVKEEIRLFPVYQAAASGRDPGNRQLIQEVIEELRREHENAGDLLHSMRRLTNDYQLPEDACATYDRLFRELAALESDLFEHIHKENNILFDRALG